MSRTWKGYPLGAAPPWHRCTARSAAGRSVMSPGAYSSNSRSTGGSRRSARRMRNWSRSRGVSAEPIRPAPPVIVNNSRGIAPEIMHLRAGADDHGRGASLILGRLTGRFEALQRVLAHGLEEPVACDDISLIDEHHRLVHQLARAGPGCHHARCPHPRTHPRPYRASSARKARTGVATGPARARPAGRGSSRWSREWSDGEAPHRGWAAEEVDIVLENVGQLLNRHHASARRGELDRQRNAVDARRRRGRSRPRSRR